MGIQLPLLSAPQARAHLHRVRGRVAELLTGSDPLAKRKTLRFDQTLDHEHVGLQPSSAVYLTLQRAAARVGRTVSFRAVVSNFDAALRVVAANLAISVIPAEVGAPFAETLGIKLIPLSDAWAQRRHSADWLL